MPAFVNNRFGESGMSEADGTMVWCFDLKKSRNDWRICVLVIMAKFNLRQERRVSPTGRRRAATPPNQAQKLN
jgi:hypothetical protein